MAQVGTTQGGPRDREVVWDGTAGPDGFAAIVLPGEVRIVSHQAWIVTNPSNVATSLSAVARNVESTSSVDGSLEYELSTHDTHATVAARNPEHPCRGTLYLYGHVSGADGADLSGVIVRHRLRYRIGWGMG